MISTAPRLLALLLALPITAWADGGEAIKQKYHELSENNDMAGLEALWRDHPAQVLETIDADLEGSLKLIEEGRPADDREVKSLRARARKGAVAADAAFGRVIFSDYAMSFSGWNKEQQVRFRAGQKAHGEARAALKAGDHAAALAAGQRCVELAHPLGDWWGTAMGWGDIAQAREAAGDLPGAATAHSTAHLLYHDLGLVSAAERHARALAVVLEKSGQLDRAMAAIEAALAAARSRRDTAAILELSDIRVRIHSMWYERNFGGGRGG